VLSQQIDRSAAKMETAWLLEARMEQRQMQEGLRVAAEIQASLLPHTPTQVPGEICIVSNCGTYACAAGLWNKGRRGVCSRKSVGQRHDKSPKPGVPAQSLVQHLAGYQTHGHVGDGLHCGATRAWVKDSFFAKD
jgi:hypothetical protein